ncbi:MAG: ABC transporter ATP-binding protein [Candidatus Peregrinibacteria bacterium]|nr:ABC transporter ATP-binding protein [Candidatus Peregrinibacteria bacterium]
MPSILSCTEISKTFRRATLPSVLLQDHLLRWRLHRKQQHVQALQNVSLSLRTGEWLGLYGPNGGGKTTLLRILAGLMRPDAGSVYRGGTLSCFFDLGVGFHPERTAEENIRFHNLLHGISGRESSRRMREILDFAGLGMFEQWPFKCYSTGMKLRLAFAAIAHIDADIYLLDEVMAVGDREFQDRCKDYLQSMKRRGKAVILVSHSLPSLEEICDRVLFLERGRIEREESVVPISHAVSALG